MTVSSQTCRTSVTGTNAIGQEVPFTFPVSDSSDLVVISRVTATGAETTLVETTNYTVDIDGDSGGTVTMVTAVATTSTIHVIRDTPMTQPLDLESGGTFDAEDIEDALDKNTKLLVENADAITRTLRFPKTDPSSISLEIPAVATRASKWLYFGTDGAPTVAASVTPSTSTVSAYMETVLDDASARASRSTLGIVEQATYTVYKVGTTYYADASPEFNSTNFPNYSNANFVDLMDSVMGIIGKNGTQWIQGNSVVAREGVYTLTKTWTIQPTQEIVFDFTKANFYYSPATGNAIEIDSCVNCLFSFGLINSTTTGKAVRIYPQTVGPDYPAVTTPIFGASTFWFKSILNTGGCALCLDATAADNIGITFCTFHIAEFAASANPAIEILNPLGNPSIIDGNAFFFQGAAIKNGIQVGKTGFTEGIHRNYFCGRMSLDDSAGNIGIDIYGIRNLFDVIIFGCSVSGTDVVLRSGAADNTIVGYLEDGFTDSSGVKTNTILGNKGLRPGLRAGTATGTGDYNGSGTAKNHVMAYTSTNTTVGSDLGVAIRQESTTANTISGLHFSAASGTASHYPIAGSIEVVHGTRTASEYHAGDMKFLTAPGSNVAGIVRLTIESDGTITIPGTLNPKTYNALSYENNAIFYENDLLSYY